MKFRLALAALLALATVAAAQTAPSADAAAEFDRCFARAMQAWDNLHAYSTVATIQERVRGKLRSAEKVRSLFVKTPRKLYCRWLAGGAYTGLQTSYVPDRDGEKNFCALEPGLAGLAGVQCLALDSTLVDKFYPHQHRQNQYDLGFTLKQVERDVAKARAAKTLTVVAAGVDAGALPGKQLRMFKLGLVADSSAGLPYRRCVLGFDEETGMLLFVETYDFNDQLYSSYKVGAFVVDPAWTDTDFTLKKLPSAEQK